MYLVGAAKSDITAYFEGVGMLGFGLHFHTMQGVETPLLCRAFYIETTPQNFVFIAVCDLAFITLALKEGVLKEVQKRNPSLPICNDNLMLLAQHTHSAPGGYSYYPFYNIPTPGFHLGVYNHLVDGIATALLAAFEKKQPATIQYDTGTFDFAKKVAFNRSPNQYNLNPEVTQKIDSNTAHLGVDRTMQLLRFKATDGSEIGSINWFGVHTTSVSNDLNKVCWDNKGYAAEKLEHDLSAKNPTYLGAFAQGISGDVSPRFVYNKNRKFQRGKWEGISPNDYESAQYNGELQAEKALEIIEKNDSKALDIQLDFIHQYVDFSSVLADKKFANGNPKAFTSKPSQGMAFFGGAYVDGPGAHPIIVSLAKKLIRFKKKRYLDKVKKADPVLYENLLQMYESQGVKDILIETYERKVLNSTELNKVLPPAWMDPSIRLILNFFKIDGHRNRPWTATVLPIQLIRLGEVAIAALPFEITTIAGKRLKETIQNELKYMGVNHLILAPIANGYAGYVTTQEEYQAQMYEGGHTVFGQWTLAALQTKFEEFAQVFKLNKDARDSEKLNLKPEFNFEEVLKFSFYKK